MPRSLKDGDDERDPQQDVAEFDRFRDLAEKLVKVPKPQIDAERGKEDERKGGSGSPRLLFTFSLRGQPAAQAPQ